ncbi:MAG TPA: hypothetical protein VKQ08_07710 [Cyclobacteriaceae bacterium]|nr:hypothetical protein [Cyclobacteriaceae bacterium]
MKVVLRVIWLSLMVPGMVTCQILPDSYDLKISSLTGSIARKNKSEFRQVKQLFHRSHRKFLKNYKAYATPSDIFERGSYDCLSGTYLLSLGLDNLGIKHRIIETNYHIFLIAETDRGDVLLESTDRFGGIIANPEKIEERICNYRSNTTGNANQLYLSHVKIYHEILLPQLLGLFYFNQAVAAFHRNDLAASKWYLESAWKIYDNLRVYEFTPILIHSILQSQLDEGQKATLTSALKQHLSRSQQTLAIR